MVHITASLFLPYTIKFDSDVSSAGSNTPHKQPSNGSSTHAPLKPSLLVGSDEPKAPEGPSTPFGPRLPLNSPALHFVKPSNPRTLARADTQPPEWGRGQIFNQPRSKALDTPPSTILEYSKAQEIFAAKEIHRLQSHQSRTQQQQNSGSVTPARTSSHEKSFNHSDWNIAPSMHGNGALTNALQAAADEGLAEEGIHHFGTLGFPTDALPKAKKDEISDFLDSGYDAHTVWTSDSDFDGHYSHYCKTMLWPVFNYQIPDHPKSKAYADHSWKFYVHVNEAFADAIVQAYKHEDTIWIHDYHLLLVPKMIRQRIPDARIGFFLHNAFPSSEIFRCLATRNELLEGMLGANLVVFQVEEYAYHFKQTCGRILNLETTEQGVQVEDRLIHVSAVPIGTVREELYRARMDPEVAQWTQTLSEKYKDKTIIASRDKLDSIRGIKQKFLAFEIFLEQNPDRRQDVVLIQVVTSTANDDKDLDAAISDIVTRINAKFSTLAHSPIVFLRQDIAFSQYLALLTTSDVWMVTPLRDGMNLTCHDFIECQDGRGHTNKRHGSLILSEFTGSSEIFQGHEIAVNPWDLAQMARAIKYALKMRPDERDRRYAALYSIVERYDGSKWPKELLQQLKEAYSAHQLRDSHSVPRLPINAVSTKYRTSSTRLFIFDYEGTLDDWGSPHKRQAPPSDRTIETLQNLISDSDDNVVYVGSQRTQEELVAIFKDVPQLGLIAENGCFVRPFGKDEWVPLGGNLCFKSSEWKEPILQQLRYYNERIQGSVIEERSCSLLLHYDMIDQNDAIAAERQAAEMANHINEGCQNPRVKAVPFDKTVSVQTRDINKVTACEWILKDMQDPRGRRSRRATVASSNTEDYFTGSPPQHHSGVDEVTSELSPVDSHTDDPAVSKPQEDTQTPRAALSQMSMDRLQVETADPSSFGSPGTGTLDFLMVAGDDREDEPVYTWANKLRPEEGEGGRRDKIRNVFSVCIGKRNTEAAYTVTQGVSGFLTSLRRLTDN